MNRISPRIALAAAAAVVAIGAPVAAHHSTAMFEWGTAKPLTGMTVEKWEWTNPHTFLYARDAEGKRWAFEGMSPNHLVRYGWSKRSVAPGDKIDLTYYPLRDGRRGGFNVTITKADGKTFNQFGEAGSRTAAR
ncbi:MAG: DUF6152 family protein [Croceibacterium sp.]